MEKLQDYQGWSGRFHEWRTGLKERVSNYREEHPESVSELARNFVSNQIRGNASTDQDFSHIYRKKTRLELIRISAAVMGIEFSYAAETAFVSPTLLKIGVEHKHMTLVWALSPLVGFFLTPILGSVSDRCKFNMGRRRPFIILLSIGVFLGLLLVPNGEELGYIFGDINPHLQDRVIKLNSTINNANISYSQSTADSANVEDIQPKPRSSHPWGIFFTILGTVFLDFHADACQSPSRAYLLDVTIPEDHARGLSTFTIMAGLGGFMGYSLGGIDWDRTYLGQHLGGHLKAVFTLITFIFVICVAATITSFKEIPLWIIAQRHSPENHENLELTSDAECTKLAEHNINSVSYGSLNEADAFEKNSAQQENKYIQPSSPIEEGVKVGGAIEENDDIKVENQASQGEAVASLSHYMLSIVLMPHSVRMVCLTNLFCWMAHVCYSLYFTDFVGESVFEGDPRALEGSAAQLLYEEGVRFGCWGMAMYSLSCACYSTVIEKLILKYRAKRVYVGGLLFYCAGMSLMALTKAKFSVIVFSWAAGVMYSTLFTLPYLLIAHYHATGTFAVSSDGEQQLGTEVRGLGTDIAIVSSMVFLAQFILSLCMGSIVSLAGTTTAVVSVASILSFCGALSATQIMYLDL